jgi:hypothetical protein
MVRVNLEWSQLFCLTVQKPFPVFSFHPASPLGEGPVCCLCEKTSFNRSSHPIRRPVAKCLKTGPGETASRDSFLAGAACGRRGRTFKVESFSPLSGRQT